MLRVAITAPEILAHDGRLIRQRAALQAAALEATFLAPQDPTPGLQAAPAVLDGTQTFSVCTALDGAPGTWLLSRLPVPVRNYTLHALRTRAWIKALHALAPDVVVASAPEALIAAARAKHKAPRPFRLIYDAHEFYDDELGEAGRNAWVRRQHQRYGAQIDALITVSEGLRQAYQRTYPLWPQAQVISNASPFVPTPYTGRLHQRAGLAPDRKIVLFHGALNPHRGLDLIAELLPHLRADATVVVMGKGPLEAPLRQIRHPQFVMVDPVPYTDLGAYLSGASIGLILYEPISENQRYCAPNKLFEYTNLAVPCLAYETEGMRPYRDQLATLRLTPFPSDPPALAGILNEMLAGSGDILERRPLSISNGLPNIFSPERQAEKFIDVIKNT